jgi:hypothetical protein
MCVGYPQAHSQKLGVTCCDQGQQAQKNRPEAILTKQGTLVYFFERVFLGKLVFLGRGLTMAASTERLLTAGAF